ncbi:GLPGLI family protein [Chryseobacterium sp. 16F]|uniref:GLPGLI family protein n=2 Tax=Frigoriflavimonas asaccharolytica TaxID=2735899 RepID=A0A8J8G4A7_9FLAO|nr:GLPGLI family protein [Frigoriflavimonas asaccharolytica]
MYSYKYLPDSTKIDSILTEETILEIFKDHSEFVSNSTVKYDSAMISAAKNNKGPETVTLTKGNFKNNVYKSRNLQYSIEFVGIQPYKVVQKPIVNWKLTNETKTIQKYICQKATLEFGGRIWEAWFTQEIPFQDGPYIFSNLPGLIIEMNDSKKHYSFILTENFKTDNTESYISDKQFFKSYEVSADQFNKKWKEFYKNPIGAMEQFMNMNPGVFSGQRFDLNGKEIDYSQSKREEKINAQKQLVQNNNPINLNLYKVD